MVVLEARRLAFAALIILGVIDIDEWRLRRVYDIDVSVCPNCGGALKVLAVITEPQVITSILAHLSKREPRAPPVAA